LILELKNGIQFKKELFLNGKNCFELIDFKVKNKLFQNALQKIDEEISLVAELSKDKKEGLFLWCLTYDNHRADGVIGMVLDYYFIEIIEYLIKEYNEITELKIYTRVTKSFKTLLRKKFIFKIIDKTSVTDKIKHQLRFKIGPLKTIFQILARSFFLSSSLKSKLPDDSVLFLKPLIASNTRLKGFPGFLESKYSNVYFLDTSLLKIKKFGLSAEQYDIKTYKLSVFFKAFVKALKFTKDKYFFLKEKDCNSIGFINYLNEQSFLQTYFIRIKILAYEEVFKQLNPKCVVVSSTFGDPQKRMPLIIAKKLGIDTILFSCRPFITNMRSEDRIIKPDLLEYNNSTLGNNIYIFDKPSYNHLLLSGFPQERIKIYNPQKNIEKEYNNNYFYSNSILLLFAHPSYNNSIINLMRTVYKKGVKFQSILYREHPNDRLTNKQIQLLQNICDNLECISNKLWIQLKFSNILSITSNSTSGIDATSRGATLLWLPFLTEHSIQFSQIINNLGYVAKNKNEFFIFINNFINDKKFKKQIEKKCKTDYSNFIKFK
jgi:hypothetical protein